MKQINGCFHAYMNRQVWMPSFSWPQTSRVSPAEIWLTVYRRRSHFYMMKKFAQICRIYDQNYFFRWHILSIAKCFSRKLCEGFPLSSLLVWPQDDPGGTRVDGGLTEDWRLAPPGFAPVFAYKTNEILTCFFIFNIRDHPKFGKSVMLNSCRAEVT